MGRDFDRRPRSGSTHHEPHRPVTTPECRSQLPLSIDRPPPRSANGPRYASSHARGYPARFSSIARDRSAAAISRRRPCPTITTPAPHLTTCGSQIPIDRARRTTAPLLARGFLVWDVCCQERRVRLTSSCLLAPWPGVGALPRRHVERQDWDRGRVRAVSRDAGARKREP